MAPAQLANSSPERTKEMAHYVIYRAPADRLGATKLNKVMWFADLEAYRMTGKTISQQQSYQRLQYGPVPNRIVISLRELEQDGKVLVREVPTPTAPRKEFIWLESPNINQFTALEVDIMNEAIDWVCHSHTANSISDFTHDALWREIELGEQIPIGAASVAVGTVTAEDLEWAERAIASDPQ